eukprot:758057-Hanusia_phi.AAC.3
MVPLAFSGQPRSLTAFFSDLLTIRADIHGYYYGREVEMLIERRKLCVLSSAQQNLFNYHEKLVEELCRECPHLLGTLLDGLLWHSKEKLPGRMVYSSGRSERRLMLLPRCG